MKIKLYKIQIQKMMKINNNKINSKNLKIMIKKIIKLQKLNKTDYILFVYINL